MPPNHMARGSSTSKRSRPEEQFIAVDDLRLQMALATIADKYSNHARLIIYHTYNDLDIAASYRAIRASGVYQKGSKSKTHRKIIEFPNAVVYDFVNAVLSSLYGSQWLSNRKALKHELVRPWWVVNRL